MSSKPSFIELFITKLKEAKNYLPLLRKTIEERGNFPKFSLETLPHLNRKIWGLKPGLTIIGGRVSQGKTSFALQIAYDLASQGHLVLFLSLEMTVEALMERLFCNVMEIDNYVVLTGQKDKFMDKWQEFEQKVNIPLWLACGIGKDFEEINQILELLDPKPQVIILDYIQAIRNIGDERQNLNEYIRKFREICVNNEIVGILCSQVSRRVYEEGDREPCLANLKGTGGLEELADTCLLLHWQHFYDESAEENTFKVIIAKQRNGRIGEYLLHYKPQFYKFYDEVVEEQNTDKVEIIKEIFEAKEIESEV